MTAEEIYYPIVYPNGSQEMDDYQRLKAELSIEAMHQFAQQQAVEFLNWFMNTETNEHSSASELYQEFLNSQTK